MDDSGRVFNFDLINEVKIKAIECLNKNCVDYGLMVKIPKSKYGPLECAVRKTSLVAAQTIFNDFWARDAFFASLGLLSLIKKEFDGSKITRETIDIFLNFQKQSGVIPRRIDLWYVSLKYFGIPILRKRFKPSYRAPYSWFKDYFSPDSNILLVLSLCEYVLRTKDKEFFFRRKIQMGKLVKWLESLEQHGLICEDNFSGWMDSIGKRGYVAYTNVLYYWMYVKFAEVLEKLGYRFWAEAMVKKLIDLKNRIQNIFWDEKRGYFIDFVEKNKNYCFSTDGNLLAIASGLANKNQIYRIREFMETMGFYKHKIYHQTNFPKYPIQLLGSAVIFGSGDLGQNNSSFWPWLGCLDAVCYIKEGNIEKAYEILNDLADVFDETGFWEIYNEKGKPWRRFLRKSARNFSWNAGMFLWAVDEFEKAISNK